MRLPSFIPEFISRLPSITALAPLTIPDLRRILTEVKGSLVSQYMSLFQYSGVEIRFTSEALDEVCKKAFERGGGARGLRGIMVSILHSNFRRYPSLILMNRNHSYLIPCMKCRKPSFFGRHYMHVLIVHCHFDRGSVSMLSAFLGPC